MIVMGIDPGTAITGFGIVDNTGNKLKAIYYGSIFTEAKTPLSKRLNTIYESITRIIEAYNPEEIAIESLFFNNNAKTALSVGHARGVSMLACIRSGIEIAEYTPLQVKMALTGYGRADKKQMTSMVRMLLNLNEDPKPDDTADALAIAICHINSRKLGNNLLNGDLK